jgi:hypothetical protein
VSTEQAFSRREYSDASCPGPSPVPSRPISARPASLHKTRRRNATCAQAAHATRRTKGRPAGRQGGTGTASIHHATRPGPRAPGVAVAGAAARRKGARLTRPERKGRTLQQWRGAGPTEPTASRAEVPLAFAWRRLLGSRVVFLEPERMARLFIARYPRPDRGLYSSKCALTVASSKRTSISFGVSNCY